MPEFPNPNRTPWLGHRLHDKHAQKARRAAFLEQELCLRDMAHDPSMRDPYKYMGILAIHTRELRHDFPGENTPKIGDSTLELHLPEVPLEFRRREMGQASLKLIAQYLKQQQLDARFVHATTYQRLATAASRIYGFNLVKMHPFALEELQVEQHDRELEYYNETTGKNGGEPGQPWGIYLPTSDFLDMYAPANQEEIFDAQYRVGMRFMGEYRTQHIPYPE